MLILKAVSLGPLHGYGVLLRIQQISKDRLEIQQGSLYPALYRLEHQGWISGDVGRVGKQSKGQVLPAYSRGQEAAAEGDVEVESHGWPDRRNSADGPGRYMRTIARLRSWFRGILRRASLENEMNEELRFHLQAFTGDLIRRGVEPGEASRRARLEFGGIDGRKEDCRASLGLRPWDELCADLRFGLRSFARNPGFTAVAVLSLGLGIGVNTAIFSLVEEALLNTLAVPHPEELRLLHWVSGPNSVVHHIWGDFSRTGTGQQTSTSFSYPVYRQLRRENKVFQDLFAFKDASRLTAVIDGHAELVTGQFLSGNAYQATGARTAVGRSIAPVDDDPQSGIPPVVVIGDAFWTRRFGRSLAVIGKPIELNGTPMTIVGVNSPRFTGMKAGNAPDVFIPLSLRPRLIPQYGGARLDDPDHWWVVVMGRLRPDVSDAMARAALDVALTHAVEATMTPAKNSAMPHIELSAGSRGLDPLRANFTRPMSVLMSLSGLVLLIACANLANLLLAKSAAREREIGMRMALGAGRARIIRQLLTESMLLAASGGAAGLALGYAGRHIIPSLLETPWLPGSLHGRFDWRVLAFAMAITFVTALLFGLAPAWRCTREDITSGLRTGQRSAGDRSHTFSGNALVVFQVSLSALLLIGAGLFVRTLVNLESANIGFEPHRILLFEIEPPRWRYTDTQRVALFERLERALSAAPGVTSVSASSDALIANNSSIDTFLPTGRRGHPGEEGTAWSTYVGARFFETMGIPILAGRPFNSHDGAGSRRVAVINERLARKFFPNENPLGKTFNKEQIEIAGVCANVKFSGIRAEAPPTFYVPYAQYDDEGSMTFELKTSAGINVVASVRNIVRSFDKELAVIDIRTQEQQIDATLAQERLFASLTSGFGLLALALAGIGIYGTMAYRVARRTGEIGIRMALGAKSAQVLGMILREASWMVCGGVSIGAAVALVAIRSVSAMLYGLKPDDPVTMAGAAALLLAIALLAAWLPARKASRVDPITALRHE